MDAPEKKSRKPSATKAESLLEQTTFFVDRSLGRAIVAALRAGGWKIEAHDDHFPDDTPDEEWLPEVGRRGWVVLTKDKAIRRKAVERQAVLAAKVRMFTLPSGNMTSAQMAEIYLSNQHRIARFLHKHQAPFVAVVYRDDSILLCPLAGPQPDKDRGHK